MSGGYIYILGSHTGTLYEDIRTAIAGQKQRKG